MSGVIYSIDSIPINRYIYTTLMVNDRSLSPVSYFLLIAWTIGELQRLNFISNPAEALLDRKRHSS